MSYTSQAEERCKLICEMLNKQVENITAGYNFNEDISRVYFKIKFNDIKYSCHCAFNVREIQEYTLNTSLSIIKENMEVDRAEAFDILFNNFYNKEYNVIPRTN